MVFLDTNILVYSISSAPGESAKRDRARAILDTALPVLSVQVLQEFYVQATRPTRPDALPHAIAAGLVLAWSRFRIVETSVRLVMEALDIKHRSGFSYWDAAILAAAKHAGCDCLYSEDLSHGQVVDGTRIVNPFL